MAGRRHALLALGLLASGCIHHLPPVQLVTSTPVAAAVVVDRVDSLKEGDLPSVVPAAMGEALHSRNLEMRLADPAVVDPVFAEKRGTGQRLRELAAATSESPLLMLVELKATYFEEVAEEFRWTVYAKVTLAKRGEEDKAVTTTFDVPLYLLFAHQMQTDALAQASSGIADKTAAAVDAFLSSRDDFPLAPRSIAEAAPSAKPDAIYFVLVDRYANGDPTNDAEVNPRDPNAFHGGDVQGVLDHLDDIQAMGFRTLWLSPVFAMRSAPYFGHGAYHGYWVTDLNQLEPRFGDRRLLQRLSSELHRRGMRLLLDVVLNHVAFDAPLTRDHPDWFHHQGSITDWSDPDQLVNRDVMGLPDLAQEREDVYQYLLRACVGWIDQVHPDGFRLDAVKHIPLAFWSRFNRDLRAHAGASFELLGEDLEGDPSAIARIQREGDFSAMFDFPLRDAIIDVVCKDQPMGRLGATITDDRVYADPRSLVTLVDNHDLPRILTACGSNGARAAEALQVMLAMRGTPSVIWGTESGLTGEKEPENRGDMVFGADTPQRRAIIDGLAERSAHPVLATGAERVVYEDAQVVAVARTDAQESVVVLLNNSPEATTVTLPAWLGPEPVTAPAHAVTMASRGRSHLPPAIDREVDISAASTSAKAGDAVLVAGMGPELGQWNPAHALALQDAADGTWHGRTRLPSSGAYELKLIVRHPDGKVDWEPGQDRFLFVPEGDGPVQLSAEWGKTG